MTLPDPIVYGRKRETWVGEDRKRLNRAVKTFMEKRLGVVLRCLDCGEVLEREQTAGGFDMLCRCKRRVMVRGL